MSYGIDKLGIDTCTHARKKPHRETDGGNKNTWRPKLALGKKKNEITNHSDFIAYLISN